MSRSADLIENKNCIVKSFNPKFPTWEPGNTRATTCQGLRREKIYFRLSKPSQTKPSQANTFPQLVRSGHKAEQLQWLRLSQRIRHVNFFRTHFLPPLSISICSSEIINRHHIFLYEMLASRHEGPRR
jgi:hypothetical protein